MRNRSVSSVTGEIVATKRDSWIVNGINGEAILETTKGAKRVEGIYFITAGGDWWFATRKDGWKKVDPQPCKGCGKASNNPFSHCGVC